MTKKLVLVLIVCAAFILALLPHNVSAENNSEKFFMVVDTTNQQVRAYELMPDGTRVLVKSFICSTGASGTPTPSGLFRMGSYREEFGYFPEFKCWAQFKVQINYKILFHSVLYRARDVRTLTKSSLNNLGRAVSHGCVRLMPEDAKWIYYNCPENTQVLVARFKPGADFGQPSEPTPLRETNKRTYRMGTVIADEMGIFPGMSLKGTAKTTVQKDAKVDIKFAYTQTALVSVGGVEGYASLKSMELNDYYSGNWGVVNKKTELFESPGQADGSFNISPGTALEFASQKNNKYYYAVYYLDKLYYIAEGDIIPDIADEMVK